MKGKGSEIPELAFVTHIHATKRISGFPLIRVENLGSMQYIQEFIGAVNTLLYSKGWQRK